MTGSQRVVHLFSSSSVFGTLPARSASALRGPCPTDLQLGVTDRARRRLTGDIGDPTALASPTTNSAQRLHPSKILHLPTNVLKYTHRLQLQQRARCFETSRNTHAVAAKELRRGNRKAALLTKLLQKQSTIFLSISRQAVRKSRLYIHTLQRTIKGPMKADYGTSSMQNVDRSRSSFRSSLVSRQTTGEGEESRRLDVVAARRGRERSLKLRRLASLSKQRRASFSLK